MLKGIFHAEKKIPCRGAMDRLGSGKRKGKLFKGTRTLIDQRPKKMSRGNAGSFAIQEGSGTGRIGERRLQRGVGKVHRQGLGI